MTITDRTRVAQGLLSVFSLILLDFLGGCSGEVASSPTTPAPVEAPVTEVEVSLATSTLPSDAIELRQIVANKSVPTAQRVAALRNLGSARDFEGMPDIIDCLDDGSKDVRIAADQAAKRTVGAGVRIHWYDPPDRLAASVASYRRLYALAKSSQTKYFIDLVPILIEDLDDPDENTRRAAGDDLCRLLDGEFGFRADAPREERLQCAAVAREMWNTWNAPGNKILEYRRDPEKLQRLKEEVIKQYHEKRSAGQPGT